VNWWGRLWSRNRMESNLEKELCFHIDEHANDLIAGGANPEEARRKARITLGGPEQVKEACRDARGTRWLEDFVQDFRYTLRTLRQRPGFAAVILSTLALGIGATTVMFTVINGVLLKPLPYPEFDRLVTIEGKTEKYGAHWGVSYPNYVDAKEASRSFATMTAWSYSLGTISKPGEPEHVEGRQISADLFGVFGIPLSQGRAFLRDEDRIGAPPVVIISESLWQRRFARSAAVIGSQLVFDGRPYTIVGVAPEGFQLDGEAEVFTPLGQVTDVRMKNRAATFIRVVARLRSGVTLAQAHSGLSIITRHLAEQYPETNKGLDFEALPFREELVGDVRPTLWLLLGAVGLVLLIACVNVASLLLARAVSRERELAMRMALGAGRGRLIRQCLTESAVLGLCGGALGVLLADIGVRPFLKFWPGILPRAEEVRLDWHVLIFAVAASLASGLLFGLAPALRAPWRNLEETLRAGARTVAGGSRRLQSSFVMAEIALAVVLLVAAGILGRTVLRLSSLDPGFNAHNVLAARVALSPGAMQNAAQLRASWQDVLDRARRVPGVQAVALSDIIPMRDGINSLPYWTSAAIPPPDQMPMALASCASPDYLKVMGIPLLHGRFFDDHDQIGSELVVVIDDVLAHRAFAGKDPVGERLWIPAISRGPVRVVGVVGHVRHWGLAGDDVAQLRDQFYYPFAQVPDVLMRLFSTFMSLTIRTGVPPLNLVEPVRRQVQGATSDQTIYEIRTMEQLVANSLARQRFLMILFGIFAGLALLLACIGIYGVLAYVTSQRVPEIGVRMALGATARNVMGMVFRQSLRMIFAGVVVGLASAYAAARLLEKLVTGVRYADPATFAIMILILVTAALLASFLPARRASRVNPTTALRQE
jgi:predicted permease